MLTLKIVVLITLIAFAINSFTYFYIYKKLCDFGYMPPTALNPHFISSFHVFLTKIKNERKDTEINKLYNIYRYLVSATSIILIPFYFFVIYTFFM